MNERRGAALAASVAAVAHLPSLGGTFQFDDYNVIVNGDFWGGVRPLLKATYALNRALSSEPFGFLVFNVAVHALNAALFYWLGSRVCARWLGEEKASGIALAAALLFALHPAQTEAVSYICGRSSSLSATFVLGSLSLSLRGFRWWAAGTLLLGAAVKETALAAPALLPLFTVAGDARAAARRQAPLWIAAGLGLAAMLATARYRDLLGYGFTQRGVWDNVLTQLNGVFYLVERLTTLRGYNIDPGLPELTAWTPALALKATALLGLTAAAVLARRRPELGFGALWFLIALAPTNSFIPRLDPANDRQLYLACWGPLLALAVTAARSLTARRATAAFAVLLAAFAASSVLRQRDYSSEIRLWESSVRLAPHNARGRNNLGMAYQEAGRMEEARAQFREALRLRPDYVKAGVNLRLIDWDAPR